jgi:cyclopropane fatty-acyl-phospholipid synthase-like methyltransferase
MEIRFFKKVIFLCSMVLLLVHSVFGGNIEDSIAVLQKDAPDKTGQMSYERAYDLLYNCALDSNKQIEVILKEHPPTNDSVVIDIGSGWGRCTRYLALLGYTVYSIELNREMQQIQENKFCDFPIESILTSIEKQKSDPSIWNKDTYINYCKETLKNRVHFIEGDFSDKNVISAITQKHPKWNIVIALDSLQFFNDSQRKKAFQSIDKHLVSSGILIVSTLPKKRYRNQELFGGVYDFKIEDLLTYPKIITGYTKYSVIDNMQYNTINSAEKNYPKFLRLVTLVKNKFCSP